ncbi:GntR family transcriptional regulator [Micromonospora sp. DR5-3]|uniref:GntR family transcriptional regulator n=1 Tax=unclassified Micromonospora TaxID=2617518 RepID=UPI0016521B06|nr:MULTISPECIES: GntR family transcriptional regulator [unclassified Micromonospora]MCW3815877.1 GntR family transcriptional regulator [Micromonospora sp. DR5-3]
MLSEYVGKGALVGVDQTGNALLSESAYAQLCSRLVRAEIMPGDKLVESALRADLGLGLSPVREAIRRLEFEKLVVIYPRSGTYATEIALKDSRSVMELRLELESLATTLACSRGSKAEKEQLVALAEEQAQTTDLQRCIDLDAAFHESIYRMSRNEYLVATARVYFNLALRQWYFCSKVVTTPDWTGVDHRSMAAAVAAEDAATATEQMREHVRHDSQQVFEILTNYGL